jgi:uncharacterized protein YecE (DUF72 family)
VGTSGYNFPEWKGTFYPAKLPAAQMLEYYAQRLSTVEVNYTFYRMPNAKTVAGWDAATPAGFTFVLKAPQRITHMARLRDVDEPLRYFLETARKLGPKLGPILFQLPPNFKKDLDRLNDLLTQFPADLRCAWEFRHESWFADDVYQALRAGSAALCVADTELRPGRSATCGCAMKGMRRRSWRTGPRPCASSARAGRRRSCSSSTRSRASGPRWPSSSSSSSPEWTVAT